MNLMNKLVQADQNLLIVSIIKDFPNLRRDLTKNY